MVVSRLIRYPALYVGLSLCFNFARADTLALQPGGSVNIGNTTVTCGGAPGTCNSYGCSDGGTCNNNFAPTAELAQPKAAQVARQGAS